MESFFTFVSAHPWLWLTIAGVSSFLLLARYFGNVFSFGMMPYNAGDTAVAIIGGIALMFFVIAGTVHCVSSVKIPEALKQLPSISHPEPPQP